MKCDRCSSNESALQHAAQDAANLAHFHMHHTDGGPNRAHNGTTIWTVPDVDVLVISDPLMRACLRKLFASSGILDFPKVPSNSDRPELAYVMPIGAPSSTLRSDQIAARSKGK